MDFFFNLKIDYYKYNLFYVSFLITTKQKIIVNTQTIKKKEYKHSTKETQNTKQKIKKKKKRKTTKTARKQLITI